MGQSNYKRADKPPHDVYYHKKNGVWKKTFGAREKGKKNIRREAQSIQPVTASTLNIHSYK
jgi:hypothetical protein